MIYTIKRELIFNIFYQAHAQVNQHIQNLNQSLIGESIAVQEIVTCIFEDKVALLDAITNATWNIATNGASDQQQASQLSAAQTDLSACLQPESTFLSQASAYVIRVPSMICPAYSSPDVSMG